MYKCKICNKEFIRPEGYCRHLITSINKGLKDHKPLLFAYRQSQLKDFDNNLELISIDDNIYTIRHTVCGNTYKTDYLRLCPNCLHQRLSDAGKKANTQELRQRKSELQKQKWQDTSYRQDSIKSMKESFTNTKKQYYSDMMKERWQDPKYKQSTTKAIQESFTLNVRSKMSALMFERWQDQDYKRNTLAKINKTNTKLYGNDYPFQVQQVRDKIQNTMLQKYGTKCYLNTPKGMQSQGNTISNINKDIAKQLGITEFEYRLDSKSYDLKKGNFLIEVDPYYTHNTTYAPYIRGHQKSQLSKDYHLSKTLIAEQHNFHCIHIFDWDDVSLIKQLISDKEKIYARNTILKEITQVEANQFLDNNHLQGSVRGQDICLGLYYNDTLVQLMTFGKPRYNTNYEYELLRLCSSTYQVTGGSSKLFKYFITKYKPKSIISYCDRSKFQGKVYTKLGFTLLSKGRPSRHWYHPQLDIHITDNLLSKHGFTRLVGHHFNNTKSNHESNEALMLEHGFVEIYDCGQDSYIWKA